MRLERYRLVQDAQTAAYTQGTRTQKWALEHSSTEHTAPPCNSIKIQRDGNNRLFFWNDTAQLSTSHAGRTGGPWARLGSCSNVAGDGYF